MKPTPGQSDVVFTCRRGIYRQRVTIGRHVVWHRPRFEGAGKSPLLLRDYAQHSAPGIRDRLRHPSSPIAQSTSQRLRKRQRQIRKLTPDAIAKERNLDPVLDEAMDRIARSASARQRIGEDRENRPEVIPAFPLKLLKVRRRRKNTDKHPAINGWRRAGRRPADGRLQFFRHGLSTSPARLLRTRLSYTRRRRNSSPPPGQVPMQRARAGRSEDRSRTATRAAAMVSRGGSNIVTGRPRGSTCRGATVQRLRARRRFCTQSPDRRKRGAR